MSDSPPPEQGPRKLPAAWAIVPVASLGFLSWVPFLYASVRTHARKYRLFTGLYLALAILAGALVAVSSGHGQRSLNDAAGLMLILLAGAGCAHTLSIRSEFGRQLALAEDPRLLVAEQRVQTRDRAMDIVRTDPQRAIALGIGRPDVPGSFDAGLIDVNHVGPDVLSTLPGIDADRAKRILELRMNGAGFESAADLDMVLDLDPGTLAELSARAIFLPRF